MRIIQSGFGAVGQSLAGLLESRDDIYTKYGIRTRFVAISDSSGTISDESGLDTVDVIQRKRQDGTVSQSKKSIPSIIQSMDADVLIEATPSNYDDGEPGMTNITTALKKGMHVISVNKGPLALAQPSLVEMATYNGVYLRFSGTVGGGTPILNYAKNALRGERITSFRGILNGTTNYILTNMGNGLSFDQALNDARSRGYVEADESLDLDGWDVAAKLTILSNWVMEKNITIHQVERSGIRDVTQQDIQESVKDNCALKLVANCSDGISVGVEKVPINDPLCVYGTLNAASFTSEHSGTQTIIGRGAGGVETASSILRDLLDIRQAMSK